MPYSLRKQDGKWVVINTEKGTVKGHFKSQAKAQRQLNLLRGVEHGWSPSRAKK